MRHENAGQTEPHTQSIEGSSEQLRQFIAETTKKVEEAVHGPGSWRLSGESEASRVVNLPQISAGRRHDCAREVMKGESAAACLEIFFRGLGGLFRGRAPKVEPGADSLVETEFAIEVGKTLNAICAQVEETLPRLINREGEPVRLTDKCRSKFAKDLLGDFAATWPVIDGQVDVNAERTYYVRSPKSDRLTDTPKSRGADTELEPDPSIEGADLGPESLLEELAIAHDVAAQTAALLAESRESELAHLKLIAKLRQEIAMLSYKIAATESGKKFAAARNESSKPLLEALDPERKYPAGEGIDSFEWLRVHWGHRLRYFGAPEDSLFQDQLRRIDPGLLRSLQNRVNYLRSRGGVGSPLSLRDIIPTKIDRASRRIERLKGITPADAAALLYRHRNGGVKAG